MRKKPTERIMPKIEGISKIENIMVMFTLWWHFSDENYRDFHQRRRHHRHHLVVQQNTAQIQFFTTRHLILTVWYMAFEYNLNI